MNYCCEMMEQDLKRSCKDHDHNNCVDNVIYHHNDKWGLLIHDGGTSYYQIYFCPWCGKKLSNQND